MKIYVTRHSLTLWNEEKRLQGWKDSPLTKQGINDAQKLSDYIKDYQIDQIYSSPIERAYQTSLHIFPNKKTIKDDRLKEMNFGDFEGKVISDLRNNKEYHDLWYFPTPDRCLKNGESYQQVVHRLQDFIMEKYNENAEQTIFITIHGMLFTILHGLILGLPIERFNEVNQEIVRGCSLTLIEYNGENFKIHYIGKDDYLTPLTNKIVYK